MHDRQSRIKVGIILATIGLVLAGTTAVIAADEGEVDYKIKARGMRARNIERAAADLIDLRVTRLSTDAERRDLVSILQEKGNHALDAALAEQKETGWIQFDPRGGGGPGRDPRKTTLRYAREVVNGDTREIILVTDQYIGFGARAEAANGAKLADFPMSFVLIRLKKEADGEWKGVGRLFVGARLKYDSVADKLVIDSFFTDPVYLRNVTIK
jgi:hypothetical protein